MAKKVEIEEKEIEAPYELPEGWKWVRLGDVFSINPKVKADDTLQASFIPMEKIEPNNSNKFSFSLEQWGKIKKNHTQFQDGDVCFAKISPCFENGKAFIASSLENGIGAGTTELIVLRNHEIDCKYTFYFVSDSSFINKGKSTYSGTVGQQRISMDFVKSYPFPLPPFAEQQRIVNRIEILFAKLDEAKEKAQNVVDSFESRKAAILHQAFTGRLTAKWRKENGISDDSWEEKSIGDAMKLQAGKNISAGSISQVQDENNKYHCFGGNGIRGFVSSYNNEGIHPIIGRQGALCGNVNLASEKFYATEHAVVVTCPSNINPKWAYYTLTTMNLNQYATATAQPGLAVSNINKLTISVPSIPEQQEIVRILDTVLEKESTAKSAAEQVLGQIDLLKKSILARAFRGKL